MKDWLCVVYSALITHTYSHTQDMTYKDDSIAGTFLIRFYTLLYFDSLYGFYHLRDERKKMKRNPLHV